MEIKIDFNKNGGIVPVIVQDANTDKVLMLGYMNAEALEQTSKEGRVTFFSRSKQRLWTKGETSGNFLQFKEYAVDCDNDTLLVKAVPCGPTCHTGADTCFGENNVRNFLMQLEQTIIARKANPREGSYTSSLFSSGTKKIAQKVGEEAVEFVIEALVGEDDRLLEEGADLIYHMIVLLVERGFKLSDIVERLERRSYSA